MIIADREYIKPLFGMDWLREFIWTILHVEKSTTPNDQSKIDEIIAQFEKQFQRNETNKDPEIKIQLKPGHILKKKQKATPILYNLPKTNQQSNQTRTFRESTKSRRNMFPLSGNFHRDKGQIS